MATATFASVDGQLTTVHADDLVGQVQAESGACGIRVLDSFKLFKHHLAHVGGDALAAIVHRALNQILVSFSYILH